ncbi:c-type cytochrome [Arhodomonas sp. SL1]|uniref:c-type cytochrome n=1 Tax=Arhodomonas sp. SL1 TaxID=3425691 RepID=UPI003F882E8F
MGQRPSWVWPAAVPAAIALLGPAPAPAADGPVERGEYLFRAALCAVCHTAEEGEFLAGGRPLPSPFGTFYTPNITPHEEHGIGAWSDEDFVRALREGVSPAGEHYYPSFPYTSYTRLRREDMIAIKRYLDTVEPVAQPSREHELSWYAGWRLPLAGWKWWYLEPGPFEPDPDRDEQWNRGAYLAEAAGHCAECHSPRGWFGAVREERRYAGAAEGPEGEPTPNITPHPEDGIGDWTVKMLSFYLEVGMDPDGDFAGSLMAPVIDDGTAHLSAEDREALATYILSLPPREGP